MLMGSVTAVITTLLLLLQFFDNPFHADVGGLQPVAMERTLRVIDLELEAAGLDLDLPCDEQGDAR
jgi:hypothetical protein